MSLWVRCDNECGTQIPPEHEDYKLWIKVSWYVDDTEAEFCTTACAVAALEQIRSIDTENALALNDGEEAPGGHHNDGMDPPAV